MSLNRRKKQKLAAAARIAAEAHASQPTEVPAPSEPPAVPTVPLTSLNPSWIEKDGGTGLQFDCPHCGVPIELPSAEDDAPRADGKAQWRRTGDSFETLTLYPSVNIIGHWHGWIENGQCRAV